MDHIYKSLLQSYALKHNRGLSVFAVEREGPDHNPRFRCKVTVCEQTFQSYEIFPRLKSAEHAAAKEALASLKASDPEGADDVNYKNPLQEIVQKKNLILPVYAISTFGLLHSSTFTSIVECGGNVYQGKEAKTEKLAEMDASRVALRSMESQSRIMDEL